MPPLYKDQLPSLADLISINTTYLCVGTLVRSTSLRISCHQSAIGRLYTCGSVNLKVIQRSVNCHGRAFARSGSQQPSSHPVLHITTQWSNPFQPPLAMFPTLLLLLPLTQACAPSKPPSPQPSPGDRLTPRICDSCSCSVGLLDFYPVIFLLFFIFS